MRGVAVRAGCVDSHKLLLDVEVLADRLEQAAETLEALLVP